MDNWLDFASSEPALVSGLIVSFCGMLAAFGLALSQEQVGAVVAVVGSALTLWGAFRTRGKVYNPKSYEDMQQRMLRYKEEREAQQKRRVR